MKTMRQGRAETLAVYSLLLIFSVGYFVVSIRTAIAMPFANDEVFVAWTLRTFTPGQLIEAIRGGTDSLPPGYYYLQFGVAKLFGVTPFWLRLSSILSFFGFMAGIFWMLRARVPLAIAGLAAMLPLVTSSGTAAVIARPYAIVCACFVAATILWRSTSHGPLPLWRAAMLAMTIGVAIAMHFFATMFCPVLGLMEALRSWRQGRWHWQHWAAIVAGGASVFLWWPVIGAIYRNTHASTAAPAYYARPTFDAVAQMSSEVLTGGDARYLLLALMGVAALSVVLSRDRRPDDDTERSPDDLDIVGVGALALPAVAFLFAVLVTRSLSDRHIFEAVLGTSVVMALILRRVPGAPVACLLLMAMVTWRHANPRGAFATIDPAIDDRVTLLQRAPEALPVVIADASDLFDLRESAPASLQRRLVFMQKPAGLESPDPEPELIATFWRRFLPDLPVVNADDFMSHTPRFYVLTSESWREGLTNWLIHHGHVRVVDRDGQLWLLEFSTAQ